MKKKLLIGILFIIITLILLFIIKYYIDKNILKNEKQQIEILNKIYSDITNKYPYYVEFDKSSLRNIVTNEYFSTENIETLKSINDKREKNDTKLVLSSLYNKHTKILSLKLKTISKGHINQVYSQSYNIVVKKWKLDFTAQKAGNIIFFDFVPE